MCLITGNPTFQQSNNDLIVYKVCIVEDEIYKFITDEKVIELNKLYINTDSLVTLDNIGTITVFSGLFHCFRYEADADFACSRISKENSNKKYEVIQGTIPANTDFLAGLTFWNSDVSNAKYAVASKQIIFNKFS